MPGLTEDVRLRLAQISERHGGIPVRWFDDVSEPADDGAFVVIKIYEGGRPIEALVTATEIFYECLGKVNVAALPGSTGKKLS